jgi:hypothetical protein
MGAADMTLVGDGAIGTVRGSLVLDDDHMGATFVRSNGVLAAGSYTLTLASRTDGWRDAAGHALDGNADGTAGGDYVRTFTVAASASAILSVGEVLVGPGQALAVAGNASTGLPVSISNAAGVTSVSFKLAYDPLLMQVSGIVLASSMPAGSTVSVDLGVSGLASVTVNSTASLGDAPRELVRILGSVPTSAVSAYGAKQVLDLFDVQAGGVAGRADDGILVNAYPADADASASYSTLDQQRLQRVVTLQDTGFSTFALVDPVVVADVNDNRSLTSADSLLLAREVNWLTTGNAANNRAEIAPIPAGIGPFMFSGADPVVDIPQDLAAVAGGMVTVPVRLDTAAGLESVQLQLTWDARQIELVTVRRGTLTGDFQFYVAKQQSGSLLVDMSRLAQMEGGQGSVLELDFRVADSASGSIDLDLQWARLNNTRLTLNPAPLAGPDVAASGPPRWKARISRPASRCRSSWRSKGARPMCESIATGKPKRSA